MIIKGKKKRKLGMPFFAGTTCIKPGETQPSARLEWLHNGYINRLCTSKLFNILMGLGKIGMIKKKKGMQAGNGISGQNNMHART